MSPSHQPRVFESRGSKRESTLRSTPRPTPASKPNTKPMGRREHAATHACLFPQVRKKVLERDRMAGVQDFLKLENVYIWVTPVGRAEEADGLGLRVKRNSRLPEPLVFGKNVDDVEGDMRHSR